MNSKFLEETNKEFQEFMEADPVAPPREISEKLLAFVRRELNPSPWLIFSKLSFIHLVVGVLTLSLCPQFGVRFLGEGPGVMRLFVPFGAYGCIALCGAFFVGMSLFASGMILQLEELRVLRGHRVLQISALTLLSLGFFVMMDAEILIGFGVAWALGSILGGITLLEAGRLLRLKLIQER